MTTAVETFEDQKDEVPEGERLLVDVDGYEGPIDVLLALARDSRSSLFMVLQAALAALLTRLGARTSSRGVWGR